MAMKQTQTKLFDFSDVGLDFCAGSKNLFPDRFKKMLSLGYNEQTVSSVVVSGDQVTFTYGGAHGYAQDRVLKVDSGALASINNGEFWIDSVTTNTVTITIDDAPLSVSSGFATRIASLGWSLEYEQPYIHIYKMRHIDDTERYARLCFQNNAMHRNCIAISIGKNFSGLNGQITDSNALQATASVTSPNIINLPKWDFSYQPTSAHNNWSYAQGVNTYGKGLIIGSLYHLAMLNKNSSLLCQLNAILPVSTHYETLQYPMILCNSNDKTTIDQGHLGSVLWSGYGGAAYIGNTRFRFDIATGDNVLEKPIKAYNSLLSPQYDNFDTTTCAPIQLYEYTSAQFMGYCLGMYFTMFALDAKAPETSEMPRETRDVDLNSLVFLQDGSGVYQKANATFVAVPVERVKYA